MAEENKMKRFPVSMQPDIEDLLKEISPADFAPATKEERDDFIQERQSVSYWKDAWRRLKKNVVAMVALGVIIFLILFAFVGPYLIPYGSRIKIMDGAVLEAGDELTEGSVNPHDILKIKGVRAVQDYMIQEVQRVYRLQGVEINDKHI